MKQSIHGKDTNAKFQRRIGKKRIGPSWKLDIVARLAPHELDNANEDVVQAVIEGMIQSYGAPYLHLPAIIYALLRREADKGNVTAMDALGYIKDFPDLMIFRKIPGEKFLRALPLELKRKKRSNGGTKGQRLLADALGGTIAIGLIPAQEAVREFFA